MLVAGDWNPLYELSRENGDKKPWSQKATFGKNVGKVVGVSHIEGLFGDPGVANLELVVNAGGQLLHYAVGANGNWSNSTKVADTAVVGVPSLIQTKRAGKRDNLEPFAAAESGSLIQLVRGHEKSVGGGYPWSKPVPFSQSLGVVTAVSAIHGPYGKPGNIELVAIEGGKPFQL